jgi:Xaa-Pro dipeptidase
MIPLTKLSFPEIEYRNRLSRVQQAMADAGLDGILCHSMSNICYLTGYESLYLVKYYMALVPREGDPVLLCQDFEMHNATVTAWTQRRESYKIGDDPVEATVKLLQSQGYGHARIGVELNDRAFTLSIYLRLKDSLPEVAWADAGPILDRVRLIKSSAEIDMIRRASRISSQAMADTLAAAGEGKSDNELAAAAGFSALKNGSEYMCIDPIITVGRRSGIPHTTHRREILTRGDTVFMEIGACIHRYTGVTMRTAFIGPPAASANRMAEGSIRSVEAMIENIKPGRRACDVATQSEKALGPVGQEFLWHGYYGYSIGIGFPPDWADVDFSIRKDNPRPLEPGMVFHCSTSLREIGRIGVAFSETILVTEHGCEVLTTLPRKIFVTQ